MKATTLRVSVVVPSYGRPDRLADCLQGVARQRQPPHEVIVAVRGGDRDTQLVVEAAKPQVRSVVVGEPGVLAAMAAGARTATGEILAFIDDDAIPAPDWLQRLSRGFTAGVVAVGGRDQLFNDGIEVLGDTTKVGQVGVLGRVVGNHHLGAGQPRDVDVLKGVNLAVRSDAFAVSHRLRGSGAQPSWELEMCERLRSAGGRLVYDPSATVEHRAACRGSDSDRTHPRWADAFDAAHNELFALMRWASPPRAAVRLGFQTIVGSRDLPGPVLLAERLVRGAARRRTLARALAVLAGRLIACTAVLHDRLDRLA